MRERIIFLLKHNAVIQKLFVSIMSAVFRFWGLFLKTDENLVLLSSFMGKGFNDSPMVLYEHIKAQERFAALRCVWAFEEPENYPQLETVRIDSAAYFKLALQAKYWITNTNIERGLHFKKKGTFYLNTWHGIALKYIGNDCPGRKDYNFDTVNYLVVSGEYDKKVFKSAFQALDESFLRCGMPRNDELWAATEEKRIQLRSELAIPEGKRVILYAPTWRESEDGGKSYVIKPPINFQRWRETLGEEYVVLFRAHHQTTKIMEVEFNDFVRNFSDYPMVNDLMIVADCLITDYSAIAFDYSILCRPILCFAYDYDTYMSERGTYFSINEKYPNKYCLNEGELLARIKTLDYKAESEKTKKFRDEFIEYGGHAAEQCINTLFDAPAAATAEDGSA